MATGKRPEAISPLAGMSGRQRHALSVARSLATASSAFVLDENFQPMPTLFDDLRDKRERSGLSLAELASKTGYTLNTIWELEIHGRGTMALFDAVTHALDLHIVGLTPGKALGLRLKAARLKRGLSIEALATKAGCSAGAVSRVENGQARVASMLAVANIIAPEMRFAKPLVSRFEKGKLVWLSGVGISEED